MIIFKFFEPNRANELIKITSDLKAILVFIYLICYQIVCFSQVKGQGENIWYAKEFSKEIALFSSKNFLMEQVFGASPKAIKFSIIPLAAASSGELTTLLYKCEDLSKEGMVLGFYGNYWNDAGILYQGFAFKNLEKDIAIEFLFKIYSCISEHTDFLHQDNDNNNVFFTYDDINVLIYTSPSSYIIRLFWNGFDSTWEKTAFERSKRRFEKKIK